LKGFGQKKAANSGFHCVLSTQFQSQKYMKRRSEKRRKHNQTKLKEGTQLEKGQKTKSETESLEETSA